jgi:serine phosphatase RsbU (regulator of sigma subunit)
VESVYLPANEVGGDFFLFSPSPDGSLVALVGDVSGKGLLAAMRVSMILGVLRRESSRGPATILANLNQALLTQGEMGFTTACCVHLQPDGRFTLANAGHIAPYRNGQEVETEPALPLGLADDQTYPAIESQLAPGEKLVLMSDGVVEARTSKGELLGFERLKALALKPARQIAEAAQLFGQEDDITVLTLACSMLMEEL